MHTVTLTWDTNAHQSSYFSLIWFMVRTDNMIFFYCREKILCDQKSMSFAVNFFLASLAFPLLVCLTSDLEMDTTSSCALLAVSDSSGGRCNFCRNTIEYWSVRWKLQYGNSRSIRVVGGKMSVEKLMLWKWKKVCVAIVSLPRVSEKWVRKTTGMTIKGTFSFEFPL